MFLLYFGRGRQIPVNLLMALLSSLVFITLGSLLTIPMGAINTFVDAIRSDWALLTFVAFNIFADGISLVETRWMLQQSREANIPKLIRLAVFDIAASALIFLYLPTVTGEAFTTSF